MAENKIEKAEKVDKVLSIEELDIERETFIKLYNKAKRISTLVAVAFLVMMFVGLYIMISFPKYIVITIVGMIILFLVMHYFKKVTTNNQTNKVREYARFYRYHIHNFVYKSNKDIVLNEEDQFGKLNPEVINETNAFNVITHIETNDLIKGTYKKKEFITSNLAVYKAKSSLGFFGRVYMFELKNKFDKKTTIHLYNKEKNISNLKVFEEEKVKGYNFDVYSALEEKDLKKLLNQKVIDILNSVELNENVREVACVIENHQLTVFSDFSENLVNIPTDKKIDKKVFETLKKDLNMVLSLVDAIK